jgi:hypothetical protein
MKRPHLSDTVEFEDELQKMFISNTIVAGCNCGSELFAKVKDTNPGHIYYCNSCGAIFKGYK